MPDIAIIAVTVTRRTLDLDTERVILHGDPERYVGGSQEQLYHLRIAKELTDTCAVGIKLMFTSTARYVNYDTTTNSVPTTVSTSRADTG